MDDIPDVARFRRATNIPLGTGAHEYTRYDARPLTDTADDVQADGALAGGYTEMLKIAALTEAWNVKFAPHAMENMHIHLVSACRSAAFPERFALSGQVTAATFADAPAPVSRIMTIPHRPRLGLNEDVRRDRATRAA